MKINVGGVASHEQNAAQQGFITNCLFQIRESEQHPLFTFDDEGKAIVRLDRYALITMERYEQLVKDENAK